MEVGETVQHHDAHETVGTLYGKVNPVMSTEALITLGLLRAINQSATPLASNVSNEAVFELNRQGQVGTLFTVAAVEWSGYPNFPHWGKAASNHGVFQIVAWRSSWDTLGFTIRPAVNGLTGK
jgi:hypothetical protein